MGERYDRTSHTNGMNTWRAGCSESCTSGSEGGPGKPTSKGRKGAPVRPYTEHPTREGKVYCAVVPGRVQPPRGGLVDSVNHVQGKDT